MASYLFHFQLKQKLFKKICPKIWISRNIYSFVAAKLKKKKEMYRSFTCEELLSLSNDEVNELKGLDVVVTKRDGNVIESTIDKIMVAVDPSCLPCYFVPSDDPSCLPCGFVLSDGKEVRFDSIRRMEIESAR